jgi:hypothetical protein
VDSIRIKVADNGYMMEYEDPAVVTENHKKGGKYTDPSITRVYATQAALMEDLAAVMPDLKAHEADPAEEDTEAFNDAFKSES